MADLEALVKEARECANVAAGYFTAPEEAVATLYRLADALEASIDRERKLREALREIDDEIPGSFAPLWYLDGPAGEIPHVLNDPEAIRKEANALIEAMRERARQALDSGADH